MGYMFRLISSHLQALKEYRSNLQGSQVYCGIPSAYIVVYRNSMESYIVPNNTG